MTYALGPASKAALKGVHPNLVAIVNHIMEKQAMDFSVREGVRTIETQKKYLASGATKTMDSKHLVQPDGYGHAVDLYPSPIDMVRVNKGDAREIIRFGVLAGLMLSSAKELGIKITWGGDWDRDGETLDHSFFDAPHFELS